MLACAHVNDIATLPSYHPYQVLACGHVDDVVIGPPRQITKEMLAALKVIVCLSICLSV